MKKLFIICALALATTASAEPGKVSAKYSGVIEKFDAATKTLTVQQKDRQGVFVLTDTSEVLQGKTKADASALTAGQKVDLVFVMDGATKVIQKVKVSGAADKR